MIHITAIGILKGLLVAVIGWAVRDEYKNSSYEIKYKHPDKEKKDEPAKKSRDTSDERVHRSSD